MEFWNINKQVEMKQKIRKKVPQKNKKTFQKPCSAAEI